MLLGTLCQFFSQAGSCRLEGFVAPVVKGSTPLGLLPAPLRAGLPVTDRCRAFTPPVLCSRSSKATYGQEKFWHSQLPTSMSSLSRVTSTVFEWCGRHCYPRPGSGEAVATRNTNVNSQPRATFAPSHAWVGQQLLDLRASLPGASRFVRFLLETTSFCLRTFASV